MRSMQQILDVVISHGYYNPYIRDHYFGRSDMPTFDGGTKRSYYMCDSLTVAWQLDVITQYEMNHAKDLIDLYMRSANYHNGRLYTMYDCFAMAGLPNAPIDLMNLYRDWESRPTLTHSI